MRMTETLAAGRKALDAAVARCQESTEFRIPNTVGHLTDEDRPLEPLPDGTVLIDLVYERLVAAIADGRLAPGQRLRQDEVAALLGVSRQPVSHALQLVKRQGLAVEHGRKGLAVAPLEAGQMRDLYQVRAALDALAAGLAAERGRSGLLERAALAEAERALAAGLGLAAGAPQGALIRADVAFHTALYRLSGNAAIEAIVAPQWPQFMRAMGAVLKVRGRRAVVWREHGEILAAVRAGEVEPAARAAREHALRAGEQAAARLEAEAAAA
jgi:DNA-binding GntR family transcriptional regulator